MLGAGSEWRRDVQKSLRVDENTHKFWSRWKTHSRSPFKYQYPFLCCFSSRVFHPLPSCTYESSPYCNSSSSYAIQPFPSCKSSPFCILHTLPSCILHTFPSCNSTPFSQSCSTIWSMWCHYKSGWNGSLM